MTNQVLNRRRGTRRQVGDWILRRRRYYAGEEAGELVPISDFLMIDELCTPEVAPITTPRNAEPGPGIWNINDSLNVLDIENNKFQLTGTPATTNDPNVRSDIAFSHTAGKGYFFIVEFRSRCYLMWSFHPAVGQGLAGVFNQTSDFLSVYNGPNPVATINQSTIAYHCAVILRPSGSFILIKGGEWAEWSLIWVAQHGTQPNLYPWIGYRGGGINRTSVESPRVVQLPAPFDSDFDLATEHYPGVVPESQSFTHEADCILDCEATTLSTVGSIEIRFRRVDANNYWRLDIATDGQLLLYEVVSTSPVQRGASAAGAVVGGDRINIICDDEMIEVFINNVSEITYNFAVNFKTATTGNIESLATDGVISNFPIWPRIMSGLNLAILESATRDIACP